MADPALTRTKPGPSSTQAVRSPPTQATAQPVASSGDMYYGNITVSHGSVGGRGLTTNYNIGGNPSPFTAEPDNLPIVAAPQGEQQQSPQAANVPKPKQGENPVWNAPKL